MSLKAIWKPSLKFPVEIQVLPGIKEGLGPPHWPDILQKDHEDQVHEVDVDHEDQVDVKIRIMKKSIVPNATRHMGTMRIMCDGCQINIGLT